MTYVVVIYETEIMDRGSLPRKMAGTGRTRSRLLTKSRLLLLLLGAPLGLMGLLAAPAGADSSPLFSELVPSGAPVSTGFPPGSVAFNPSGSLIAGTSFGKPAPRPCRMFLYAAWQGGVRAPVSSC